MQFVRLETSDGETRWINLDQVIRVTSARHATTGNEVVVVLFAGGGADTTFKLAGETEQDRAAIRTLKAHLEALDRTNGCTQTPPRRIAR